MEILLGVKTGLFAMKFMMRSTVKSPRDCPVTIIRCIATVK